MALVVLLSFAHVLGGGVFGFAQRPGCVEAPGAGRPATPEDLQRVRAAIRSTPVTFGLAHYAAPRREPELPGDIRISSPQIRALLDLVLDPEHLAAAHVALLSLTGHRRWSSFASYAELPLKQVVDRFEADPDSRGAVGLLWLVRSFATPKTCRPLAFPVP